MKKIKIMIAAGGSGGHIFPAIALAKELLDSKECEADILFIGSNKELDRRIFEKEGFRYKLISANRFPYRVSLRMIRFFIMFKIDCIRMFFTFLSFRPDVVVGFGGYVSCPVMVIAALFGKPRIVHEQNASAGRANKLLFRIADKVALSFKEALPSGDKAKSADKYIVTGNPLRKEVLKEDRQSGIKRFGLDGSKLTILVIGGSQGAHFLNESFVGAVSSLDKGLIGSIQVIHLTGIKDYEKVLADYRRIDGLESRVYSFVDRIEEAYSASDLIITRGGASAIFEAANFSRAMIIVPYPFAMSHQSENAKVFSDRGAAIVIDEKSLSSEVFKDNILRLLNNREELNGLGKAAKQLSFPDAAAKLAKEVLSLSEK